MLHQTCPRSNEKQTRVEVSNNDKHPNNLIIRIFVLKMFCQSATYLHISSELNEESNNSPSLHSFKNSFNSDRSKFNMLQILCSDIVRKVTTLYRKLARMYHAKKWDQFKPYPALHV